MSGIVIPILPIQEVDSGNLNASATSVITIARRLDVSRFRDPILTARLHGFNGTWLANSTIVFECGADGYTDEDPARIWNLPAAGVGTLCTFSQSSDSGLVPLVRAGSMATALGFVPGLVFVRIKFTTAAGGGGVNKPTLSADLNLKGD